MESEGRKYELLPGRIFLLNSRTRYVSSHDKNNPLEVQAIHFSFIGENENNPFFTIILQDYNLIRAMYERIHYYFTKGDLQEAEFWVETLIKEIYYTREKLKKTDHQEERVHKITDLIQENPSKKWTVNEIAESCNLSQNHVSRLFSKVKGTSPMAYVIQCRIDMAKRYLLSTSYPVNQIGELCGYSDIYFFSRQFKKIIGISPASFRKEGRVLTGVIAKP